MTPDPKRLRKSPSKKWSGYQSYLLGLLMTILAFNHADRLALGVMLQDIKIDLRVSDTALGFLSGIAFTAFYATMGIPIARWADRGNRVTIISVTTLLWSFAVSLCGFAGSFLQLLIIRVGVAVGEAGAIPPAHSLIADHFEREERARAVSRYMLGIPLALTLGFFAAGWLNELFGWRTTFVLLGLPGLLFALLARLTLREPRLRVKPSDLDKASRPSFIPLGLVCRALWHNRAFKHLLFCFSVWFFFAYGLIQWQPSFFIRTYGLSTGEVGSWFALVYGLTGLVGVYAGGELASRYASGNERLQLVGCAVAFAVFALLSGAVYLVSDYKLAFGFLALAALGGNMAQGPMLATIQSLVPARMRAMSVALVYLFANLIGMGLGPLAAGALSDALRPQFGTDSLRYSLLILCPGYFWAAWHLVQASRTVNEQLAETAAMESSLPGAPPLAQAVHSLGRRAAQGRPSRASGL